MKKIANIDEIAYRASTLKLSAENISMLHLQRHLRIDTCATPVFLQRKGIVFRSLALGIPLLLIVLTGLFIGTHKSVETMLNNSATRNAKIEANSISFIIAQILGDTCNQLRILASGSMSKNEMIRRMQFRSKVKDIRYREVAYMGIDPKDRYLLLNYNGVITSIPTEQVEGLTNSPFLSQKTPRDPEEIFISTPTEVVYPMINTEDGLQNRLAIQVIRFTTPVHDEKGRLEGILTLSLDLKTLRSCLSSFTKANLDKDNTPDKIRVLYIDRDGWMIFQGENSEDENAPLRLDEVRAGFRGDFGRKGFSGAFRPSSDYYQYWSMINAVQHQRSGLVQKWEGENWLNSSDPVESVHFAPIVYSPANNKPSEILGCVAVLDATFSSTQTGIRLKFFYFGAGTAAAILLGLVLWVSTLSVSLQAKKLKAQLQGSVERSVAEELPNEPIAKELGGLRDSINEALSQLRILQQEKDNENVRMERLIRNEKSTAIPSSFVRPSDSIVGTSKAVLNLKKDIAQAAKVMEDVLVIGETGTGKELVSRAIHGQSKRKDGPFISINCGALDEGLLMDTLFGHVKGAYTEAKIPRKGAFLAAEGGTLMLDEIGTASLKVQQALLRALSDRCILPLGSDEYVHFNTRVIAATNADLKEDIAKGNFREDLYFRLAVITIRTTPLRQHKEDIPLLVADFLREGAERTSPKRSIPALSRGALSALMHYHWPGNIRELKNYVFRALAFCDGSIILPEHLPLEQKPLSEKTLSPKEGASSTEGKKGDEWGDKIEHSPQAPEEESKTRKQYGRIKSEEEGKYLSQGKKQEEKSPENPSIEIDNPRIAALLPSIYKRTSISRLEYQEIAGDISIRTAQYDLQSLVECGVLKKQGRGPSLRYIVISPQGNPKA